MNTTDDSYSTASFDYALNKITCLPWLPWVGRDYEETRFLVVGRNHHRLDGYDPDGERGFTRRVVSEQGIGGHNVTPFISRVPNILGCHEHAMWRAVAFHNLILRSPLSSERGFPTTSDWQNGKDVFDKLLAVLKPKFCLICFADKTSISRYFDDYKPRHKCPIAGVAPSVGESANHGCTVAFVQVLSRMNTNGIPAWRCFLENNPCCSPSMKSLKECLSKSERQGELPH